MRQQCQKHVQDDAMIIDTEDNKWKGGIQRDGYAMRIATKILNPKSLSIILGHFCKQKTTPLTILMPETSIVGFGETSLEEGDLPYSKVAMMARRCESSQLSQTSVVAPVSRLCRDFLSFQHYWSPSLQNPLANNNLGAQNNWKCVEIATT